MTAIPELTVLETIPRVDADELALLDVREADEWQAGHAPMAVHIPLSELEARVAEVPRDGAVAVICRSGARSAKATEFLRASGVTASNVIGGMHAWTAADGGLVAETDAPPQVI